MIGPYAAPQPVLAFQGPFQGPAAMPRNAFGFAALEWGDPSGYSDFWWAPEDHQVGLDLDDLSHYGQQIGQQIGEYGHAIAEHAKRIAPEITAPLTRPIERGFASAASTIGEKMRGLVPEIPKFPDLGETKRRADAAADAVERAARDAQDTAAHVKETARVAKVVLIGLGVLGGVALVASIVK